MGKPQNYQNHTRWYPFVHFIISPLLAINLIWAIAWVLLEFEWFRIQYLLLSIIVILVSLSARLQPLKAQDRIIRLEERLRYREVLSPDLAATASNLRVSQMIALRFASDEELPDLVQQIAAGKLKTSKEIKTAITSWRPDHFRV